MKTLRKNDEYVRMAYTTKNEMSKVDTLVNRDGWNFAPKQDWKEWKKQFEKPKSKKKSKK